MRRASRFAAALERRADALLGTEYKLQPLSLEPLPRQRAAAGRPQGTPIDLSHGLAAALGALHDRAACVVLFIDGSAPVLVSRLELSRYYRVRHEDRLADLLEQPPAPGFIATMRIGASWSAAGAVVGALRVVAPPGPRGTR